MIDDSRSSRYRRPHSSTIVDYLKECVMRLQLALNVADLDTAGEFYSKMFGVAPAKTKPGSANFAIDQPPLKLVLFEGAGESGSINHLGGETESSDEVVAAEARLSGEGIDTTGVDD